MLDSRRNILLACALSALAGYVDAIGFLHLGGLFVSFMSGNSTRMGVSLAEGQWSSAAESLGLIALFVTGAAAGSLIVLGRGAHRQSRVLLVEALLLAAAALCYTLGFSDVAIAAIVLAMGLENAVFQIDGGAGLGLTYVTGALVKVGQLAAIALTGGPRWAWAPNLALWAALVMGSLCGALAYAFGLPNVAVAAIVLAMGLENAVFQIEGGAGLGLTYVTGALVKVGQYLAVAVAGGDRLSWVPNFLLWAALVAGGVCGAAAYHWINLSPRSGLPPAPRWP
jgi:uncharacterized membrane protein YoaK (UPF0700 family)